MRITDYLREECVKVPLLAKKKAEAIHELVGLLDLRAPDKVHAKLHERESLMPEGTYQGDFAAFPHCIEPSEERKAHVAIGKLAEPIDWAHGENIPAPVEFILLVVSGGPKHTAYQPMIEISRILQGSSHAISPRVKNEIRGSACAAELYDFLLREAAVAQQARSLSDEGVSLRNGLK
jgi:mannitol/fructose-specific phosphotransferase system IIA component (Ntr-type)